MQSSIVHVRVLLHTYISIAWHACVEVLSTTNLCVLWADAAQMCTFARSWRKLKKIIVNGSSAVLGCAPLCAGGQCSVLPEFVPNSVHFFSPTLVHGTRTTRRIFVDVAVILLHTFFFCSRAWGVVSLRFGSATVPKTRVCVSRRIFFSLAHRALR